MLLNRSVAVQSVGNAAPSETRNAHMTWVLIAAALVMSAGLGARATFGLFLIPITATHVVTFSMLAFALALQNIAWGLAQPLAGHLADRKGPVAVVAAGAFIYALGLALVALHPDVVTIIAGLGLLAGLGQSGMTFAVIISAVSRASTPAFRATAVALAAAGGSLGQVALIPIAQSVIGSAGFRSALIVLAGFILCSAPFGIALRGRVPVSAPEDAPTAATLGGTWPAIRSALKDGNYLFLTAGFFACGFQLAFISNHLPAYLVLCHGAAGSGAASLATIGFFNIIGSYGFGRLMDRFSPQYLLAALYTLRATATVAFVLVPLSPVSTLAFAAIMGLTWLGTVPLTSGIVGRLFGLQHLGTLFGVCFFSHQVGAFLGAFLGGAVVQSTGSYALMWTTTIIVGYGAALLNLPIRLRSVAPA